MGSSAYYLRNLGLMEGLPDGASRALEEHVRAQSLARRQTIFAAPLTQYELAALVGSCREAISRALKALRDRGVITVRSRYNVPA